jgi:hypothetical protein
VLQPLQGEKLQLFVRFRLGSCRLPHALAYLHFERLDVADPFAFRVGLDEIGRRGERLRLLAELVEGIGGPIQRGIRFRALGRHQ